jgi:hypothetical protein
MADKVSFIRNGWYNLHKEMVLVYFLLFSFYEIEVNEDKTLLKLLSVKKVEIAKLIIMERS